MPWTVAEPAAAIAIKSNADHPDKASDLHERCLVNQAPPSSPVPLSPGGRVLPWIWFRYLPIFAINDNRS